MMAGPTLRWAVPCFLSLPHRLATAFPWPSVMMPFSLTSKSDHLSDYYILHSFSSSEGQKVKKVLCSSCRCSGMRTALQHLHVQWLNRLPLTLWPWMSYLTPLSVQSSGTATYITFNCHPNFYVKSYFTTHEMNYSESSLNSRERCHVKSSISRISLAWKYLDYAGETCCLNEKYI